MVIVFHFRSKCIGCNACVEANRERWRISRKDGKSTLIEGINKKGVYRVETDENEYQLNMKAMRNCPVKIIKVAKTEN